MDDSKTRDLLRRYNEGICSEEEKAQVESWYLKEQGLGPDKEILQSDLDNAKEEIWNKIVGRREVKPLRPKFYRIAVAASILMILSAAFYFHQPLISLFKNRQLTSAKEVLPGGAKAYLTLSDGKRIDLTNVKAGELIEQPGISIIKTSEGELIYKVADEKTAPTTGKEFNIIETPVGGQFQIILPDGTNVWLNASSSLKYPVHFSGSERKVELTGEGYFEVKSDKTRPFKVLSSQQIVEVLGTHFNINAYSDEPNIKTTLVEGSVRISGNKSSGVLNPGQQAVLSLTGLEVNPVDTDQAVAWHTGDFAFEGTELKAIMRQISRWYDVEVIYQGDIGDVKFGGSISRSKNIRDVLKVLQMTRRVSFRLEGRRVLVMP